MLLSRCHLLAPQERHLHSCALRRAYTIDISQPHSCALRRAYTIDICQPHSHHHSHIKDAIAKLSLSPRATFMPYHSADNPGGRKDGLSCCRSCKGTLQFNRMPTYAIANNYLFGETPQCLKALTDVELAFLTPVKSFGYIFSYTGGEQRNLKGSLSYFKVQIPSIVRSLAQLDILGLRKDVVVLLYGKPQCAKDHRKE